MHTTPIAKPNSTDRALQLLLGLNLFGITADLSLASPADGLQPFGQDGVAVVVSRVHPVSIHGGKVLDLELDERRSELVGVAELVGKGVCVALAYVKV